MARLHSRGLSVLLSVCVDTSFRETVHNSSERSEVGWKRGFRVDVLEVPLERLALESVSKFPPFADVSSIDVSGGRNHLVEERLVFVHPYFSSTSSIVMDDLSSSAGKGVWGLFAEDVTDTRAWMNLEGAAAHPDSERDLKILSSPHLHSLVVASDVVEELLVNGEQSSGDSWRSAKVSF